MLQLPLLKEVWVGAMEIRYVNAFILDDEKY